MPSKSGVGLESGLKIPHPNIKRSNSKYHKILFLIMSLLNFRTFFQGIFNLDFLRPVYKPHSVHDVKTPLCDHLSGRRVAAPLGAAYPGLALSPRERAHMKTSSLPSSADDFVPAWPCSRRGLPGHPHYCGCRWSFTPPFHHHPFSSLVR